MSRAVRQVKQFLLALIQLGKTQQKYLLKTASKQQIHALRELVTNLLAGNIPLESKSLKKLNRYKVFLRRCTKKSLGRALLEKHSHIIVLLVKLLQPFLESL